MRDRGIVLLMFVFCLLSQLSIVRTSPVYLFSYVRLYITGFLVSCPFSSPICSRVVLLSSFESDCGQLKSFLLYRFLLLFLVCINHCVVFPNNLVTITVTLNLVRCNCYQMANGMLPQKERILNDVEHEQ